MYAIGGQGLEQLGSSSCFITRKCQGIKLKVARGRGNSWFPAFSDSPANNSILFYQPALNSYPNPSNVSGKEVSFLLEQISIEGNITKHKLHIIVKISLKSGDGCPSLLKNNFVTTTNKLLRV